MQTAAISGHTTHPALHLRDANDAHMVFEAVRLGLLPLIKRRLTSDERDRLSSGNVFVWEEAEHKGGLERWTDGRRWSQSRMKGEYLFYEEKVETTEEEKQAKAARRASRNTGNAILYMPTRRQDRPAKPDGLTKQTYSTHVYLPGSTSPRKWHIVAYFSANDYARLPVIESYDYLRNILVPDRIFFSARGVIKKNETTSAVEDEDEDYSGGSSMLDGVSFGPSSPVQQHTAMPDQYETRPRSDSQHATYPSSTSYRAPVSSAGNADQVQRSSLTVLRPASRSFSHDLGALPKLSTITSLPPPGHFAKHASSSNSPLQISPGGYMPAHRASAYLSSSQNYQPLSSEDRRALSTFKIIL
ncbi:Gti1/Pac2 family-domain-containing protein [Phellopilus nigrolimitatus]|nr:Gti1/Pac2 family-domain-containing protein [Phellopilus nigrolimitatus]